MTTAEEEITSPFASTAIELEPGRVHSLTALGVTTLGRVTYIADSGALGLVMGEGGTIDLSMGEGGTIGLSMGEGGLVELGGGVRLTFGPDGPKLETDEPPMHSPLS